MRNVGFDKEAIKRKLYDKLDSDPDWKYYIDNEGINKLTELLVDGIAEVMEQNNRNTMENIRRMIGI